ncbi:D-alanyl-D-alanine carboxypeptidase/D-alanyl-D-alanine endopeptidase [Pseudoprevotella muciniphila]|nr:D-alanyl-D-alanine carboxypeptidase/D-alanyl-D-alanine-endopeptidase [Pseudoprevotella muciniphila]
MRKLIHIFFILAVFTLGTTRLSAQEEYETTYLSDDGYYITADGERKGDRGSSNVIGERINELLKSRMFNASHVGIYVYDLTDGKEIYKYNESKRLRPASNEKIVTAVTALDILSSNYNYQTKLYIDRSQYDDPESNENSLISDEGTLDGNIYVRAGFDPLLSTSDLDNFVNSLKEHGVKRFNGDIIIDQTMKDMTRLGKGWCWDDDEGVCTPMLLNGKDEFDRKFSEKLNTAGIEFSGYVRHDEVGEHTQLIYTHERNINEVLRPMMKSSDNTCAESMFFQIAMQSKRKFADLTDTQERINALVRKIGLDPDDYNFSDGSGLSIYDIVSAELIGKILIYAYNDKNIYDYFLPSLPIAGVDGTLSKRMKNTTAENNVYAKTGTVTGVSTLSGYCTAANGHRLVFSILNNGLRESKTGREFQNKVCVALTR